MRRFLFIACAGFAVAALGAPDGSVSPGVQEEVNRFSGMYFAQMDGANFFRLYAPGTGIVEFRRNWRRGGIDGAGGWRAKVETNGDVTIREPGSRAGYTFRRGSPFSLEASDGRKGRIESELKPVIQGEIPALWDGAEEDAREADEQKFIGYRLRLFYANPNHAAVLLAELALLGLFAFLYCRRRIAMAGGAVGLAVAAYLLLKTDGRGGMLGMVVGAVALLGFRLFRCGGKIRVAVVSALAVAAVVAFCVGGGLGGRFSAKKIGLDTSSRLEMWQHAPRMMVDSPYGWGETRAGRAYSDWYQPLSSSGVTPTLDSDHLTYMTGFGWFGRFAWAGIWFAMLFSLFRFCLGTGRGATAQPGGLPLPLAEFSALCVAAMFNPILHVWSLWLVPVASLWPFIASRPWKALRRYAVPAAAAAVAAISVCAGFYFAGRGPSRSAALPVFTDGRRVCVRSREPGIWVADDRNTIGWLFAPKEVRYFYAAQPMAKALGYVQKLTDVPPQVRRLAVAGNLCREYVKLWKDGVAPKAEELIFLSPGMPIGDVPESLRRSCKFAFVVGEFAARYEDVYGCLDTSDEVVQIEGAEVYLPGWVGLILSDYVFKKGKE